MGVTACFATQCFTFLDVGLLQRDADPFGCMNDFVACDLQQAAVHRINDSFLLYGSVDDDALELGGFDSLDLHRRLDGEFEQLFQSCLAEDAAKAPNLVHHPTRLASRTV